MTDHKEPTKSLSERTMKELMATGPYFTTEIWEELCKRSAKEGPVIKYKPMWPAAAIALLFLLLTPLAASRAQLAAQQPLTLQQQLDLAKAAIDHSLDSMSALIIQQDAIIASLKAPATPAQPSAAPKPKPPRPTQSPHAPNEGGEP